MNDIPGGKLAPPPAHIVYAELEPVEFELEPFPLGWTLFLLLLTMILVGEMLGAFDPEIAYLARII